MSCFDIIIKKMLTDHKNQERITPNTEKVLHLKLKRSREKWKPT